jgi:thiamine-phosphate diphosphorylase
MTRRLLCLVTDRLRLATHLGRPPADAFALLLSQIDGAARGGIDYVQIRERDLDGRALAHLVREALHCVEGTATRVLVNDRIDVAVATGAHGVHLRESSVAGSVVRRVWPAITLGRSVHAVEGAARATDADYLIAGTAFATDSKPGTAHLGIEGLTDIVRAAGGTPVLAIGGVTIARAAAIVKTGAAGLAAIGAFLPDPSLDVAQEAEKTVKNVRFAFDSASTVP